VLTNVNKATYTIGLFFLGKASITSPKNVIHSSMSFRVPKKFDAYFFIDCLLASTIEFLIARSNEYICSSETMLADYDDNPHRFIRTILACGTDQEMLELETMLILQLKATKGSRYYNMSNNLRKD